MVYTAESRSLAALEVLVHTEVTGLLSAMHWSAIPVQIEESLIQIAQSLPEDWQQLPAPVSTRRFGDAWVAEATTAVLRVPSAVVPGEYNYLINPRHPHFGKLNIGVPEAFSFDRRLRLLNTQ